MLDVKSFAKLPGLFTIPADLGIRVREELLQQEAQTFQAMLELSFFSPSQVINRPRIWLSYRRTC